MENLDEKFMREALKEASAAYDEDEVPVGAVIVCRGRVIGRGHNMTERLGDPTAHAEMIAITAAAQALGGKYLEDCTLYVTVEPCPMCAAALGWAQISEIVYGADDPRPQARLLGIYALASPSQDGGQERNPDQCLRRADVGFFQEQKKIMDGMA